ncbi:MAG: hypothetical protein ACOCW2_04545 [Chitinivibrionales bacterium]
MNGISKYLWYIISACMVAVCIMVVAFVIFPAGAMQWREWNDIKKDLNLAGQAGSFPHRIGRMRSGMTILDSLMTAVERKEPFTPSKALNLVYALADTSGCKTAKVQIDDPIAVEAGKEIPVTYTGEGTYRSIGRFMQGIENMHYATRIRQAVLRKTADDRGEVILDFIIMER